MKIYSARWPDGTLWLVSARSMEEVAERLDEAADPGACEVRLYKGPLVLEFEPSTAGKFVVQCVETDAGSDMCNALMERFYPSLHELIQDHEPPQDDEWANAVAAERVRPLSPSSKWARSVQSWWEARCGETADKSAALRAMSGVSIPGEPKPETPEQEALFEKAQRQISERIANALSKPPKASPDLES